MAYFITTLGAFGIVTVLSTQRDADHWEDYTGLADGHPWLAGVLSGMLLSLAGIPLTAGFIGKFYILDAGVDSHLWLLVIVLVVASAIGLFYYLRVITAMYQFSSAVVLASRPLDVSQALSYSLAAGLVLLSLAIALLWLGIHPAPLLRLVHWAVAEPH